MSLNISLFSTRENLNSTSNYCYYLRGKTRLWRRRWAWNTSLSMDTSEYTFRHISVCRTPAESRQEYMTSNKEYIEPCKTQDQALSLCSGSTESKILGYQGTNPREYQIARTSTKETIWIQDRPTPNHQQNSKQNKNTNPIISRDYHLTQPCPPEGKNNSALISP